MKIALDFDGILCDPHTERCKRLSYKLGINFTPNDITEYRIDKCLGISTEEVLSVYTADIYDTAPPEDGAIEGVYRLKGLTNNLKIVSNIAKDSFDPAKRIWLKKYFPDIDFEIQFVKHGDVKSNYLKDCNFLVDDYEKNFDNVEGICILLDRPWNRHTRLGVRARNWPEVVQIISQTANSSFA